MLVTMPPIGFMGSTAAGNAAGRIVEKRGRAVIDAEEEVDDQGEDRTIMIEMWKRWRKRVKI